MTNIKQILMAASLSVLSSAALAVPITGNVQIDGSGTLDTNTSNIAPGATTLTMTAAGNVNGDANLLTGDFDTFLDVFDAATFATDTITFQPSFPQIIGGTIANFWQSGGFSFELTSLIETVEVQGFINLTGLGVITGNGFDATDATITITGTGQNTLVGITTTTVAEPALALLLGTGLIGLGLTRRVRKAA